MASATWDVSIAAIQSGQFNGNLVEVAVDNPSGE
jgi:hypothetical protein